MKPSNLFEGTESTLYKTFVEATTNVQGWRKEFREYFVCLGSIGIDVVALKAGDRELSWRPEVIEAWITTILIELREDLEIENLEKLKLTVKKERQDIIKMLIEHRIPNHSTANGGIDAVITKLKGEV